MTIPDEIIAARQSISERLLAAAVSVQGAGLVRTMRIADAATGAGANVHSVGIGKKIVEGRETGTLAIRIHVIQKMPESALSPAQRLPSTVEGIPTDVIESSLAFLAGGIGAPPPVCTAFRRKKQQRLIAGVSAGYPAVFGGTIGYFCRSTRPDDDPAAVYLLSNNHVFANLNEARAGDPLYQPGVVDGGGLSDTVATLTRWVPLHTGGSTPNLVDCAIAQLSSGVPYSVECCSIGPVLGTAQPFCGMRVRKHGRTTGYTEGKVSEVAADVTAALDHGGSRVLVRFTNQIRIEPAGNYTAFGLPGDSGSLVVDATSQNAVGLYFADPLNGAYACANPITDVLAALQIALL